jgi:hypothetical protein
MVMLLAMVSPSFTVSTFGAPLLRIPLTTLMQLIDDVTSSDKLEAAKEDHLKNRSSSQSEQKI